MRPGLPQPGVVGWPAEFPRVVGVVAAVPAKEEAMPAAVTAHAVLEKEKPSPAGGREVEGRAVEGGKKTSPAGGRKNPSPAGGKGEEWRAAGSHVSAGKSGTIPFYTEDGLDCVLLRIVLQNGPEADAEAGRRRRPSPAPAGGKGGEGTNPSPAGGRGEGNPPPAGGWVRNQIGNSDYRSPTWCSRGSRRNSPPNYRSEKQSLR